MQVSSEFILHTQTRMMLLSHSSDYATSSSWKHLSGFLLVLGWIPQSLAYSMHCMVRVLHVSPVLPNFSSSLCPQLHRHSCHALSYHRDFAYVVFFTWNFLSTPIHLDNSSSISALCSFIRESSPPPTQLYSLIVSSHCIMYFSFHVDLCGYVLSI